MIRTGATLLNLKCSACVWNCFSIFPDCLKFVRLLIKFDGIFSLLRLDCNGHCDQQSRSQYGNDGNRVELSRHNCAKQFQNTPNGLLTPSYCEECGDVRVLD